MGDLQFKSDILRNVLITCRFDGAYRDAWLSVKMEFENSQIYGKLYARWYLYEPGGKDIYASSPSLAIAPDASENPAASFEISLSEPRQWSAESPFLYNLAIEITDEDGQVVKKRCLACGFRQIDVLSGAKGGQLTLNGRPVKLQGVERDYSQSSREGLERDLLFLRRVNINTVFVEACSDSEDLFELADRIGLYIIGSCNQGILLRNYENHPSFLCRSELLEHWDGRNEPKTPATAIPVYDKPVVVWVPYTALRTSSKYGMGQLEGQMNVAGIGIRNFVELNENELLDIATMMKIPEVVELRSWYAPVVSEAVDVENGLIAVINRHAFINLSEYELHWNLRRDGHLLVEGRVHQPDIRPGQRRTVHLFEDLSTYGGAGEGYITIVLRLKEDNSWGKAGDEIDVQQISVPPVFMARPIYPDLGRKRESGESEMDSKSDEGRSESLPSIPWQYKIQANDLLLIRAGLGLRINLDNGLVEVLDFGLGNILTTAIRPGDPSNDEFLPIALVNHRIKRFGDDLELRFKLKFKDSGGILRNTVCLSSDGTITYTLNAVSGRMRTDLGVRFGLQPRFNEISWYGCGPQAMYSCTQKSAIVGLYSMDINSIRPCGEKKYVGIRWLRISDGGNMLALSAEEQRLCFSGTTDEDGNGQVFIGSGEVEEEATHGRQEFKFTLAMTHIQCSKA